MLYGHASGKTLPRKEYKAAMEEYKKSLPAEEAEDVEEAEASRCLRRSVKLH